MCGKGLNTKFFCHEQEDLHATSLDQIAIALKCGALLDLVPFVRFKKREKHPSRNVNSSKVAGFKPATVLELTPSMGVFSCYLNCTNGTKSHNASQMSLFIENTVNGTYYKIRFA